MAAATCYGNNFNNFNKFLSLEHSLLLFDCDSSAIKSALYSFKRRVTIQQKPGLLFKKWKLLGAPTQARVINLL